MHEVFISLFQSAFSDLIVDVGIENQRGHRRCTEHAKNSRSDLVPIHTQSANEGRSARNDLIVLARRNSTELEYERPLEVTNRSTRCCL